MKTGKFPGAAVLFLALFLLMSCKFLAENNDLKLKADYQENPDGTITFTLTIKNEGLNKLELQSSSSQIYDIELYDHLGRLLWNWAYDKAFLCVMTRITLQPGEEKVYYETWDLRTNSSDPAIPGPPVKPGSYQARFKLVTRPSASYRFDLTI
jgi:hypothetical protein